MKIDWSTEPEPHPYGVLGETTVAGPKNLKPTRPDGRVRDGRHPSHLICAKEPSCARPGLGLNHSRPGRVILLGAVDPHSTDPDHALAPDPAGCAGWRLWNMIDSAARMTKQEYVAMFDRRNLCMVRWDARLALRAAAALRLKMRPGARVVALGLDVWRALDVGPTVKPRGRVDISGVAYYFLPHPSGRNIYYNDAMERWWAGRFLAGLVRTNMIEITS